MRERDRERQRDTERNKGEREMLLLFVLSPVFFLHDWLLFDREERERERAGETENDERVGERESGRVRQSERKTC